MPIGNTDRYFNDASLIPVDIIQGLACQPFSWVKVQAGVHFSRRNTRDRLRIRMGRFKGGIKIRLKVVATMVDNKHNRSAIKEQAMDVNALPAANTMALASTSQQLQSVMETQVAMLRELAESQQQIAQMLAEGGLGQNIDIKV